MYERFFGLRERPFELTADARFLLMTAGHVEALGNLEYAIASRRPIALLLGEAGTGKTTLLRHALAGGGGSGEPTCAVHLTNPVMSRAELLEAVANGFELPASASESKPKLLRELDGCLTRLAARGERCVLAVDEAQALPDELLEELRLLVNLESDTERRLPLILVGQPELAERLNQPRFRQLKQRIALRCRLAPLTIAETAQYMASRIAVAGGNPAELFTRDAVEAVYRHARGIPRTTSVICDNALLSGFALERRPVGADIVEEVCRDFDLQAARHVPAEAMSAALDEPAAERPFTAEGAMARGWSRAASLLAKRMGGAR